MNKEQWEIISNGILEFNHLITTPDQRKTEGYYKLSCDLVDEEYGKEFHTHYKQLQELNIWDEDTNILVSLLDDIADTLVVSIQAANINTPSSLQWEYIDILRKSGVYTKRKDIFIRPILEVLDVSDMLGLDAFKATCEVIRSNNTKLPTLDQVMQHYGRGDLYESSVDDACNAAADWIETSLNHEYDITWRIVIDNAGVDRVAFYDQKGKLRKPWCFEEPKLEGCL